jgi:hypothetical protein
VEHSSCNFKERELQREAGSQCTTPYLKTLVEEKYSYY